MIKYIVSTHCQRLIVEADYL